MNQQNMRPRYIEDDTIDPRELWRTLMRYKAMIAGITFGITLVAAMYAFMVKPVYEGRALIEIGEIIVGHQTNQAQRNIYGLNYAEDLKNIVTALHDIEADVPPRSVNILELSYRNYDRDLIRTKLQSAVDEVLMRHEEKVRWYQTAGLSANMSQLVGGISVSDEPVFPKKKLIIVIAFVGGLMLSVFMAFSLEFIRVSVKKAEDRNEDS